MSLRHKRTLARTVRPHPKEARDFGTDLLNKNTDLILQISSAIIADEFIYVINPLYPEIKEVKIIRVANFVYEARLKN